MKIGFLKGLVDNYIWTLTEADNLWVVDPGESAPVLALVNRQGLRLKGILVTHHHVDHTGGIGELTGYFPETSVYGGVDCPNAHISHRLKQGDRLMLGNTCLHIIETPGHTRDHICFYSGSALFSGDTLFTAGCGRVFEGTPEQMCRSLLALRSLADSVRLYCAHEYTLDNMAFAQMVEPQNPEIEKRYRLVRQNTLAGRPCVPSTLKEEKLTNPFLRFDRSELAPAIAARCKGGELSDSEKFAVLRKWKDSCG